MTCSKLAGLVLLLTGAVWAQSTGPSFEVASIKPATPQQPGRIMIRMGGDPGRINYSGVSLRDIVRQAYQVKDYQITGPDWMGSERFDLVAKIPDGVSRDQVPAMLQNLLAERFKLTLHREKKELPAYGLVVSKGGPKLTEVKVEPPPAVPPPLDGDQIKVGKDGMPQLPPGRGGMMMMRGPGHVAGKGLKIGAIVEMLARATDRPVVDETGLTGDYDFTLDWTPEPGEGGFGFGGPGGGAPQQHVMAGPAGPAGGEGGAPAARTPEAASGPPLQVAVQQQLGLKLEAKRLPIDLLVIEHAERVPSEN